MVELPDAKRREILKELEAIAGLANSISGVCSERSRPAKALNPIAIGQVYTGSLAIKKRIALIIEDLGRLQ